LTIQFFAGKSLLRGNDLLLRNREGKMKKIRTAY